MALEVASSILVARPIYSMGCRQVVKAPDFDSGIRRFISCHPSHFVETYILYVYGPLAQSVEHLIFNQGVRSSSLRWTTRTISSAGRAIDS